jgi:hypothetical protein
MERFDGMLDFDGNGLAATSWVTVALLMLRIVLGARAFAAPAPVARDNGQSATVDTLHQQ